MAPRTDEYEHDNDNLSAVDDDDDDDDEGLKEDMAALARACMIAGDEIPTQKDPLLAAGDALVPLTSDSDSEDGESDLECLRRVQSLYQPLDSLPPMTATASLTASDADFEDDLETVRAIFKRFSAYDVGGMEKLEEGDQALSLSGERDIANDFISYKSDTDELCPVSQDPNGSIPDKSDAGELCPVSQDPNKDGSLLTEHRGFIESNKTDTCMSSKLPQKRSSFPPSAQAFIDAIKKNRALQRVLRSFVQ